MPTHRHDDVVAVRGDVAARVLAGDRGVDEAIALLDAAEAHVDVPLVDEAERARLQSLAAGREERAPHWHSLLARRDEVPVGYAGVLLPSAPAGPATADLAVDRSAPPTGPTVQALLAGLESLGWGHGAARLVVWMRHAESAELARATDAGYGIERRLGVLGRRLDAAGPELAPPDGIAIRAYRPGTDDEAVAEVLAAAYAGTSEAGWTVDALRERRRYDWFDPEDLLVAEGPDTTIRGLHWLKRRSERVGEVYNLAIAPSAQGSGLGRALLLAGLRRLAATGCDEVLLWVDLANEPAVRLYTSAGFTTRWEDIALVRTLRGR